MVILLKLGMVLGGATLYWCGECLPNPIGIAKKEFKYIMGIPIGLLGSLLLWSWTPLLAILTYFIACWGFGYGDKNPITKLIGKRAAITLHGTMVGIASFPLLGFGAIFAGLVSGLSFYVIAEFDDQKKIVEPKIAILRGVLGTILLLGA